MHSALNFHLLVQVLILKYFFSNSIKKFGKTKDSTFFLLFDVLPRRIWYTYFPNSFSGFFRTTFFIWFFYNVELKKGCNPKFSPSYSSPYFAIYFHSIFLLSLLFILVIWSIVVFFVIVFLLNFRNKIFQILLDFIFINDCSIPTFLFLFGPFFFIFNNKLVFFLF